MASTDQNSEEVRQLKLFLGHDPDDPTVTVEFVDQGVVPFPKAGVAVTVTPANENSGGGEDRKLDELLLEVISAVAACDKLKSFVDGAAHIHMRSHKLWAQVAGDTGSSEEARRLCIQIAADTMRYVLDLIDE